MLYDSTKNLLGGMLRSLESADKVGWDDQLELGSTCLYEMHQMAKPMYKAYRSDASNASSGKAPAVQRASRAIPHVKSMVRAIRRKDQAAAVQSGRAALAEM
jgi:hypothetical protein